jgi:hypothetical protein
MYCTNASDISNQEYYAALFYLCFPVMYMLFMQLLLHMEPVFYNGSFQAYTASVFHF